MAITETTRAEINLMVIQGVPEIGQEIILGRQKKILSIALAIPQGVQYVSQCTTGLETVQIKEKILIMLK